MTNGGGPGGGSPTTSQAANPCQSALQKHEFRAQGRKGTNNEIERWKINERVIEKVQVEEAEPETSTPASSSPSSSPCLTV